jgi:hypothetical protein
MRHFFQKKPVPHAYLPIFDQILSLQSGYSFWQNPKHHQTVPISVGYLIVESSARTGKKLLRRELT